MVTLSFIVAELLFVIDVELFTFEFAELEDPEPVFELDAEEELEDNAVAVRSGAGIEGSGPPAGGGAFDEAAVQRRRQELITERGGQGGRSSPCELTLMK